MRPLKNRELSWQGNHVKTQKSYNISRDDKRKKKNTKNQDCAKIQTAHFLPDMQKKPVEGTIARTYSKRPIKKKENGQKDTA